MIFRIIIILLTIMKAHLYREHLKRKQFKQYIEKRKEIIIKIYKRAIAIKFQKFWRYRASTPHLTRLTFNRLTRKNKSFFTRGCFIYDYNPLFKEWSKTYKYC